MNRGSRRGETITKAPSAVSKRKKQTNKKRTNPMGVLPIKLALWLSILYPVIERIVFN